MSPRPVSIPSITICIRKHVKGGFEQLNYTLLFLIKNNRKKAEFIYVFGTVYMCVCVYCVCALYVYVCVTVAAELIHY